MKIEETRCEGDTVVVDTIGARFVCSPRSILVTTKIPRVAAVATFSIPGTGLWQVASESPENVVLIQGTRSLTIGSDGFLSFKSESPFVMTMVLNFPVDSVESNDQAADYRGDGFGCGIYRLKGKSHCTDTASRFVVDQESPLFFHVFPPRLPNESLATAQIAHEGRPRPGEEIPNSELIREIGQHAQIFALHAYFWQEEFPAARPRLSRYRFRANPWRSARHVPMDEVAFRRAIEDVHSQGMRFLPYVSPRYSMSQDMLGELGRLSDLYDLDGFYLDGLKGNFVEQRLFIRALRRQLGPDKIIYLNGSDHPFGSARITAPFIDTHCDFVLRGDSGKGGMSRETFLRWSVSGQGGGNQVGVWCHYGSSGWPFPFDRVPSESDQRAAALAQVMIWRRSFWWPGKKALGRFDLANESTE